MRITLIASTAYFGLLVAPHWAPFFQMTPLYLPFLLSLVVVVPIVLGLVVIGGIGWAITRDDLKRQHRALTVAAAKGLLLFCIALGLRLALSRGLPVGSRKSAFDRTAWLKPTATYVYPGWDITPRQKMVGDVVERMLPGRSRQEIEQLLGPSLDWRTFESTGRDLIYILGPQRIAPAPESEWLLIWLDQNGRFQRFQVVAFSWFGIVD